MPDMETCDVKAARDSEIDVLGVDYLHLKPGFGGDLYLTEYGRRTAAHLQPENWYESSWFRRHATRPKFGTGTVYHVVTKPADGRRLDLLVKHSRVGQTTHMASVNPEFVPGMTREDVAQASFNSPFEEIALVFELRRSGYKPDGVRILTQRPLGIYVPAEPVEEWQLGRKPSLMRRKRYVHPGIDLDLLRQYIVIYSWVRGVDAGEAARRTQMGGAMQRDLMHLLTREVAEEFARKGFRVLDNKPEHLIVRPGQDGRPRMRRHRVAYAYVDYELLERTPEYRASVRERYLKTQARRFEAHSELPAHLHNTRVLGTDYVYGASESTLGELWTVGKDPELFSFFLPERWRTTSRTNLSEAGQVYATKTKDGVNLVWRVSRVGDRPEDDSRTGPPVGINSPFEEVSVALQLQQAGYPTVSPRAIYATGKETRPGDLVWDLRRLATHARYTTPEGYPVLRPDRDYMTLWGYWSGIEPERLEELPERLRGLNLREGVELGLVSRAEEGHSVQREKEKLRRYGFVCPVLYSRHLLLSFHPDGTLCRSSFGHLDLVLCSFEYLRPLTQQAAPMALARSIISEDAG